MHIAYNTDGLVPSKVRELWNDFICRTYVNVDCALDPNTKFAAHIEGKSLGRAHLTRVKSAAVNYERQQSLLRKDGVSDLLFCLMTKGSMGCEQADKQRILHAGEFCFVDTARPYRLNFHGEYEAVHLQIPRQELLSRLPTAIELTTLQLPTDGRYAKLAATMLKSASELIDHEDDDGRLLDPILDLVVMAYEEAFSDTGQARDRYGKIFARAKDAMTDRLLDPDFDGANLPQMIGASDRTLRRAFAQHGTSPSKWLWDKRLETAATLLRSKRNVSVSEVAFAVGFNDFSAFSRAFKKRFALCPRDYTRNN